MDPEIQIREERREEYEHLMDARGVDDLVREWGCELTWTQRRMTPEQLARSLGFTPYDESGAGTSPVRAQGVVPLRPTLASNAPHAGGLNPAVASCGGHL